MPTLARRGVTFPGSGSPPPAAPSLVQANGTAQSSATNHQTPWDFNTTAGNLLIAAFRGPLSSESPTIQNTNWTALTPLYASSTSASLWIAYKIATGTEPQFNWTTSGLDLGNTEIFEFANLAGTLDKTSTNDQSSNAAATSCATGSTGVLATANEVAIAICSSNGSPEVVDSGFTLLDTATFFNAIIGYKITSATTALNPTFSWSGGNRSLARIATFQ